MITTLLIYKILQLLCFMALGFVLAKSGVVKPTDSTVLSKVSLYLLMPSAILNAFDFHGGKEVRNGLYLACAAAILIHFILILLDLVYKKTISSGAAERASVMYSNAGNLVIPIVSFVLGEEWVVYSTAFLSVQLLFLWSHGIRLFSKNEPFRLKKVLLNVNVIAIAVGVLMMLFQIRLPSFVKDITSSLGGMLGTVGMLIAGMLAASMDFKKLFGDKRIYRTALFRLVVYPAIILGVLKLLSLLPVKGAEKILLISFLASATPSAATVVQFAILKDEDVTFATAVNILTTVACVITLPLFVALYGA